MMRRARDLGHFVTNANLSLMNSTAQFLGGIKLAVSQNLQDSFVAEFHSTLHKLTGRQVAYMRQRTNRASPLRPCRRWWRRWRC